MTSETPENRLKRLRMRSWRRGTKEMDLILGTWSDAHLATLGEADLVLYDALLSESDNDLYQWVTKQLKTPDKFSGLVSRIIEDMRKT